MNEVRKILLIDDEPAMEGMLQLMVTGFRRGHYVLEYTADYAAGLRSLASGTYALCLLDYQLGARTGLELLREARVLRCSTPVILLTGNSADGTDLAALDGGAADFLNKGELTQRGLERAVCYALESAGHLAQWRDMATHDPLTGVPNRREFDCRLNEEWLRCTRLKRPIALAMLDLDRFKQINDTHGHPAGDDVLRHVAQQLGGQIRPTDSLARFGGDEFAIIMVETDHPGAQTALARLQAHIRATPCQISAQQLTIAFEISAGVAAWPEDADSLAGLIAAADAALYVAKRQRRQRALVAAG